MMQVKLTPQGYLQITADTQEKLLLHNMRRELGAQWRSVDVMQGLLREVTGATTLTWTTPARAGITAIAPVLALDSAMGRRTFVFENYPHATPQDELADRGYTVFTTRGVNDALLW